tara:strand:- start:107 stop:241 length:135 start_codon:yes stop_codon:yes gene_type:complete
MGSDEYSSINSVPNAIKIAAILILNFTIFLNITYSTVINLSGKI